MPSPDDHPHRRREDSMPDGEDWGDYRHHVLGSLGRLEKADEKQNEALAAIRTTLAVLTTKVALYAAAVSLGVAALAEILVKVFVK